MPGYHSNLKMKAVNSRLKATKKKKKKEVGY
jgi:hypothetical protein